MVKKQHFLNIEQPLEHFRKPASKVNESLTVPEAQGSTNEAQRFCVKEREWLLETAKQVVLKRGLTDCAEDLAQEVYSKAQYISDNVWKRTSKKKSYIARVIINKANDLCQRDQSFEPLTDNIVFFSPIDAMEAAILISELHSKLSPAEQELLELIFEQYSGAEIANRLGIEFATARKRVSRLIKKLSLFTESRCPKPGLSNASGKDGK